MKTTLIMPIEKVMMWTLWKVKVKLSSTTHIASWRLLVLTKTSVRDRFLHENVRELLRTPFTSRQLCSAALDLHLYITQKCSVFAHGWTINEEKPTYYKLSLLHQNHRPYKRPRALTRSMNCHVLVPQHMRHLENKQIDSPYNCKTCSKSSVYFNQFQCERGKCERVTNLVDDFTCRLSCSMASLDVDS